MIDLTFKSLTCCLLVGMLGCSDAVEPIASASDTPVQYDPNEALPMRPLSDWESSLTREERRVASVEIFDAVGKVYDQVEPFFEPDTPLSERDEAARRALALSAQESQEVRSVIGQSVSTTMIRLWLSQPNPPSERIAPYIERLLEHENPNADIIRDGLIVLEGTWSEDKLDRARLQAAEAAVSYLERVSCDDCRSSNPLLVEGGFEDRHQRITEAIVDLNRS